MEMGHRSGFYIPNSELEAMAIVEIVDLTIDSMVDLSIVM